MVKPVRAQDDKPVSHNANLPPKERALKAVEYGLANAQCGIRRAEAALAELRRLMK